MSGILTSQQLIARLRDLRRIQGKSTQKIADLTGIQRATLVNLELGRRASISLDEAAAICGALGVDLRVLLSDEPMPVARKVWLI